MTYDLKDSEKRLIEYFKKCVKVNECRFFKAKHIAKDLGNFSPKEVGTRLSMMSDKKFDSLKVNKHSHAIATTWKVERTSD